MTHVSISIASGAKRQSTFAVEAKDLLLWLMVLTITDLIALTMVQTLTKTRITKIKKKKTVQSVKSSVEYALDLIS